MELKNVDITSNISPRSIEVINDNFDKIKSAIEVFKKDYNANTETFNLMNKKIDNLAKEVADIKSKIITQTVNK